MVIDPECTEGRTLHRIYLRCVRRSPRRTGHARCGHERPRQPPAPPATTCSDLWQAVPPIGTGRNMRGPPCPVPAANSGRCGRATKHPRRDAASWWWKISRLRPFRFYDPQLHQGLCHTCRDACGKGRGRIHCSRRCFDPLLFMRLAVRCISGFCLLVSRERIGTVRQNCLPFAGQTPVFVRLI